MRSPQYDQYILKLVAYPSMNNNNKNVLNAPELPGTTIFTYQQVRKLRSMDIIHTYS